jgi:hypothetical protein
VLLLWLSGSKSSPDLKKWTIHLKCHHHPDVLKHGFNMLTQTGGRDIVYVEPLTSMAGDNYRRKLSCSALKTTGNF